MPGMSRFTSTPVFASPLRKTPIEIDRPSIPNLEDYDIHPIYGFLPADPPPLERLPDYFEPWEKTLDNLSQLLLAGRLRKHVQELPLLDHGELVSVREWQRAYLVLSFIAHGYVWGKNDNAAHVLPMPIARPWYIVAGQLGMKPIISYAAVELYNYKLLDPNGPADLSNLAVMHTFTGMDEAWFYLISLATEAAGARALPAILEAMHAVVRSDLKTLKSQLDIICDVIEEITRLLLRMYEKNDPHIFYHRVRPYVAGWENSEELHDGLFYEGVLPDMGETKSAHCIKNGHLNNVQHYPVQKSVEDLKGLAADATKGTWRKYAGASAGQSSLIHCLDVAMGIEHWPTRSAHHGGEGSAASQPSTPPNANGVMNGHGHSGKRDSVTGPVNGTLNDTETAEYINSSTSTDIHEVTTANGPTPTPPPPFEAQAPPHHDSNPNSTTVEPKKAPINHIHEMRRYMPGPHREFIYALERAPSIRDFIRELTVEIPRVDPDEAHDADECIRVFNRCVEGLRTFRDRHLQIVATYIIIQARKKKEVGQYGGPKGSQSLKVQQSLMARGTGGTDLIPFLKQSRNETGEAVVQLDI